MLRLEFPSTSHKQEYLEMMEEWINFEGPSNPGALFCGTTFEEFLELAEGHLRGNTSHGVPATLFLLVDDSNRILGALQIRHHIDHPNLIEVGGHIGYGIRPSERGKGYAKKILALALPEAQKLGIKKALITCDDTNITSAKVIESNGGIFERFAEKDGIKKRRYWIHIS